MNKNIPDRLLKFSSYFLRLAEKESLSTILKNIEEMDTYIARKEYAEKKLSHLSSGSSRIVYLTPGKTIVKLAKNDKGIAQNKAEANPKMKSKFLNKILSSSKDGVWIEVPYLEKITEKDFNEMTGLKFEDFGESIRFALKEVSGNTDKEKPKNFAEVEKSDIYKELKDIGEKFDVMPGDIARISSWGRKDGIPILIDAGLTKKVFDDFYEDSSS